MSVLSGDYMLSREKPMMHNATDTANVGTNIMPHINPALHIAIPGGSSSSISGGSLSATGLAHYKNIAWLSPPDALTMRVRYR